jgi:hypothetical protein
MNNKHTKGGCQAHKARNVNNPDGKSPDALALRLAVGGKPAEKPRF